MLPSWNSIAQYGYCFLFLFFTDGIVVPFLNWFIIQLAAIIPSVYMCTHYISQSVSQNGCISSPVGNPFPSKILLLGGLDSQHRENELSHTGTHNRTSQRTNGPLHHSQNVDQTNSESRIGTPSHRSEEECNFWSPTHSLSLMNVSQLLKSKCSSQWWCQNACTLPSWESYGSYRIDAKTGSLFKYCCFDASLQPKSFQMLHSRISGN